MNSAPLRLLLVEDSEDDAFLLLRHLKRGGYELEHQRVQTAETLRQALDSQSWDIIISDHAMPNFTGVEALEALQATGKDIPFIMVSGAVGEERAVQMMKAGAADYVMKDNLARLIPAIERELRDAQIRRERKAAEAQVYKLSSALAQSASLVMILDTESKIEFVNETFSRVTGYSAAEAIGQTGSLLESGMHAQSYYQDLRTSMAAGKDWRGEILNRKKDGNHYWAYLTVSAIRNDKGEISHFLSIQEDITERKRLESELQRYTEQLEQMVENRTLQLRSAKEQFEAILENSSDAIALALSSGDILTANPAFYALFGKHVNRSIEELIHLFPDEKETAAFAKAILAVLYDRSNERTQVSIQLDAAERIDLDLAFAPIETEDGTAVEAVIISARDITPLKDLERFKARFVANAAHDLANPIAALKTRLYLLKARPDKLNIHVEVLERQIERLERLVGELRTLSELDRGALALEKKSVDLNQMIATVLEAHQPLAAEKSQELSYEPAAQLSPAYLDYQSFERVIVNLLSNAITYTPPSGRVSIKTWQDSEGIRFSVTDTGMGIEAEALPRIFDRFFRTDRAKDVNSIGTGLGLAIVREMIEAHHGSIIVESKINIGTSFTVYLPNKKPS
jgi:PAS domain S-box-containing protein